MRQTVERAKVPVTREPERLRVPLQRIANCVGIWETDRGGDAPNPTDSSLDTVTSADDFIETGCGGNLWATYKRLCNP